jgi:Tol biopolymer transport system component
MLVNAGEKLGPYEMLAPVGAGGMGEVWKARDTRLDRIVAIKFSKEQFTENFQREAHAIAALNHPHICQLYDVGALPSGAGYLVMEYVEGEPIVSSARPGPMPFDLALKLAIQMADALGAAHSKGIVHRDLKPANVLMTKSGVKILDFGLAKMDQPGPVHPLAGLPPEQIPTEEMWEAGAIVGTLQYSSPEQLQGKATDARSDIFSFGVLLYEMLTGRSAFQADNAASLIAEVLKGPPLAAMSITPPALSRILNRCLAADPDDRWQSARDLRVNLEWVALGLPEVAAVASSPAPRRVWGAVAAAVILAAALSAGVVYWLRSPVEARTIKLSVLPPEGATFVPGAIAGPPALSPDGQTIAFVAEQSGQQTLWLRALDSLSARELPGTEGARSPFWSPDNRSLGFFSQDKLKRIDVNGGTAESLAGVPGGFRASGAWGPDDKILYAPSNLSNLFLMPAGGGQATPATHLESQDIGNFWPAFLPDGQHFLFSSTANPQIYVGTMGSFGRSVLLSSANRPVYAPAHGRWPDTLLYIRDNTLTMQRFDASPPAMRGEPRAVAEGVNAFDFSVSAEGTLAYRTADVGGPELITFDHTGKQTGSLGKQAGPTAAMRFSPDSKTVAVVHNTGRTQDIWLHDLTRGVTSRFTFNGGNNPVWSPDGAWIVFLKTDGLYAKASNGTGAEQPVYLNRDDPGLRNATDWSADGHYLLVARTDPKTGFDMWLLPEPLSKGQHKLLPLLVSPMNEGQGRFATGPGAPKWVAYNSEESGTNEIYVMTMPGAPFGKWQITNGGGYAPRWAREGRELYFIGPDLRTVMEVDVEPGPVFRPGQPHAIFKLPAQINGATNDQAFAVSPDGKTFLVAVPAQASSTSGINVVLNWQMLN